MKKILISILCLSVSAFLTGFCSKLLEGTENIFYQILLVIGFFCSTLLTVLSFIKYAYAIKDFLNNFY